MTRPLSFLFQSKKRTLWLESMRELSRPSDCYLSTKLVPTYVGRGCHVVRVMDPYGRIVKFLDQSHYFSPKSLLSCTHEAECTPFQTHYFSDDLVAPGIEPGSLDL
jgi:hypothetical protein